MHTAVVADAAKQIDVIAQLMALAPPLFLFGGFAEDALLYREVSRPHGDIDVFVWLDELELRVRQAAALGFEDMHWSSGPLRMTSNSN